MFPEGSNKAYKVFVGDTELPALLVHVEPPPIEERLDEVVEIPQAVTLTTTLQYAPSDLIGLLTEIYRGAQNFILVRYSDGVEDLAVVERIAYEAEHQRIALHLNRALPLLDQVSATLWGLPVVFYAREES